MSQEQLLCIKKVRFWENVPYDPLQNFLQNGHFVPYDPLVLYLLHYLKVVNHLFLGLNEDQIIELKLKDPWMEKCIPSGGAKGKYNSSN